MKSYITYHAHVDKAATVSPTTKGNGGSVSVATETLSKRNLMRWDMKSAKYRQRVKQSKKIYSRDKYKHLKQEELV